MSSTQCGILPSGEAVESYLLTNANGVSVRVLTYGATITSIRVPDSRGQLGDVVLGFENLSDYLAPHPYFGAIAGRVAGRITGARFVLAGRIYSLAQNDPPNHLHGGNVGFDRRLWSAAVVSRLDGADSLRLSYRSPDGEEGYPGTVDVSVSYTLTAANEVIMETEATTDQATPFSLTQHSYFNLAGEGAGCIRDHRLQILADDFAPADERMALLGRRESVAKRPNDFNQPCRLGDAIPGLHQGHGDLYFLPCENNSGRPCRLAARLHEPTSGRVLEVSTTEDCLQFYTGVFLDGSLTGKSGRRYGPHAGLCLECEGYPDGCNTPSLGDITLRPGQPLQQTTVYAFSSL